MVVLVVEDEVLIGLLLCTLLAAAGYRVLGPEGSSQRALEVAAMERPDVAFIDINLRGRADGLDVARSLSALYGTSCIFLTADPRRAAEGPDAAIGVIAKPYNPAAAIRAAEYAAALRSGNFALPRPRDLAPLGVQPR